MPTMTTTTTTIGQNTTIQCGSHEINLRKINFNLLLETNKNDGEKSDRLTNTRYGTENVENRNKYANSICLLHILKPF